MLGMVRKEICVILNNRRFLLVTLMIYILYSAVFDMDMSFFLPFMASMLSVSSFSYDDYNNWQTYAASLPQGRENIVRSKYVVALCSTLLASVLGFAMSFAVSAIKGTSISLTDRLSSLFGVLLAIILMLSVLYPIVFKYGAEKGRMALMIMGLGIGGTVIVLVRFAGLSVTPAFLDFLETYLPLIFTVLSITALIVSYFVSKKIYLNKEF